ncbi:hypothetical protein HerbRD11066_71790 [Herbidospora sp. RD11066]
MWCAVAIVGLSACASTPDLSLPLDEKGPGPEVVRAEERIVSDCLSAFGISVDDLRRESPNAAYLGWLGDRTSGYAGPGPGEFVLTGDARAVYEGTWEMHGGRAVPAGGCRQAVRDVLVTEKDPLLRLAYDAAEKAGKDTRIADAERRWAECMKAKGYTYAGPFDALGDPRWAASVNVEDPPEDGGPAEIATAADDHECRGESGWYDRRREIWADHQNRVIAANGPALAESRAYNTQLEAVAAKVLDGDYKRSW